MSDFTMGAYVDPAQRAGETDQLGGMLGHEVGRHSVAAEGCGRSDRSPPYLLRVYK